MRRKIDKTDAQWSEVLSPLEFQVTRKKATERAHSGAYWDFFEHGQYQCTCCGSPLFDSEHKFDAGCGWPSFDRAAAEENIETARDFSHGMARTEVLCSQCGAHLGHVFDDGPAPTGLRYCINSAALKFIPTPEEDSE
jgi:peptide-methionine (R)-S-oxide reductase